MILTQKNVIEQNCSKGSWGKLTLSDLFQQNVAAHPGEIALVDSPDRARFCESVPRRMSYLDVDSAVKSLSRTLHALGLRKNDVIASQLPNISEQAIVILAVLRIGAIFSPLPLMWRDHEIIPALTKIEPKAIITYSRVSDHNYAEMMREVAFKTSSVRFVLSFGAHLPDGVMSLDDALIADREVEDGAELESVDANDVATICWTSHAETDACPVPRSHNQWIAAGMAAILETELADTATPPVLLNPYPLTNLIPIGLFLVPWLHTGGRLIFHHPFDMDVFQSLIVREGVHLTGLPPTLIDAMSKTGMFQKEASNMSLHALITIWPGPIIAKKGHEWGGLVAGEHCFKSFDLRPLGELAYFIKGRDTRSQPPARLVRGTSHVPSHAPSGLDMLDIQLKGAPFKNGEATSLLSGEICLRSPMMFDQYYPPKEDGPALKLNHSADGYVQTGLRGVYIGGERDEAKSCEIDVIGRSQDVIFHGGLSISARELDALYAGCEQLSDAAAFSFEDPVMGERIMAAVVPQPGVTITLDDFIDYLNMKKVASYKLPDRIVAVNSIPRNDKGHVLRDHVLEDR